MANENHDLETMGAVPINSFGEYEVAVKVYRSMTFKHRNTHIQVSENDHLERKILDLRIQAYESENRIVQD